MMKWEQRLQAFIAGHAIAFGYAAALLLGAFLKYSYLPFLSADVKFLNAPWIDAIKQGGGSRPDIQAERAVVKLQFRIQHRAHAALLDGVYPGRV